MDIKKKKWKKPAIATIEKLNKSIVASACSKYISNPCNASVYYLDSIPGGDIPILM